MEILVAVISFVFVIAVMILVHEWGHFIAAKKLGIKVEAFSIGFGPKLISWKRGETEYRISALPLGGYVKMLGENPDEEPTDDPRAFTSKARWQRFIVLIMGPALNLLLAFLIWTVILMAGEQKDAWLLEPPRAEYVTPGGPAFNAGIQPGDLILSVNGQEVGNWEQLIYKVATNPREEITVAVERDGNILEISVQPMEDETNGIGTIALMPAYPAIISELTPEGPAKRVGLQEGDKVIAIDGVKVNSFFDIQDAVLRHDSAGYALKTLGRTSPLFAMWETMIDLTHRIEFTVSRGEETLVFSISPEYDEQLGFKRIGISRPPMPTITVNRGPVEAISAAFEKCVTTTDRLFDILGRMLTGRLSSKAISGPVEIAAISGQAAAQGLIPLLNLMAFISLNLGIINLVPLPVLDGGQITLLAVEGIIRRDINMKVKEWIMRVGVFLLLLLMVLIITQDIGKLINRLG